LGLVSDVCRECGADVPAGAVGCPECGALLAADEPEAAGDDLETAADGRYGAVGLQLMALAAGLTLAVAAVLGLLGLVWRGLRP